MPDEKFAAEIRHVRAFAVARPLADSFVPCGFYIVFWRFWIRFRRLPEMRVCNEHVN